MRYSAGAGLIAVVLLAACGSSGDTRTASGRAPGPASTSTRAPGRTHSTGVAHVMVIVEENRGRGEVIGASDMPYFNALANKYGNTTNWDGILHSSLPNYLALTSGSTQGLDENGCEYAFTGPTIGSQLAKARISWKAYAEGLPSPGSTVCTSGEYAKKHNPFAYFPESNGANVVPASQFVKDLTAGTLPAFIFYVPNLINDGHDAGNDVVDKYLRGLVPRVLASRWYAKNGTIIITWDEDEGEGRIATVVLHGSGSGQTLTAKGNHYGTLATIEDLYKLPRLGNAVGATTLTPLLNESSAGSAR